MKALLAGYRVIESSMLLNGASTAMMLVDLGAEVIKVESPFLGDYLRIDDTWHLHAQANKGKRSLALDLKAEGGRAVFRRLLATADVFVTNAVGRRNDKLGLGYEQLLKLKQDIVYCQNTGFGASGPWSELPTHGQMMDALAGAMPAELGEDGLTRDRPRRSRSGSLEIGGEGTTTGAIYAAFHIAAALAHRERTGEGCYLDVSAAAAVVASACMVAGSLFNRPDRRSPSAADQLGTARYQRYATKDGKIIFFCPEEKKFWEGFCDAVHRPELKPQVHGVSLRLAVQAIFATRTLAEWMAFALEHRLPIGPAHGGVDDLVTDPQLAARKILFRSNDPAHGKVTLVAQPVHVDGEIHAERRPAPGLGEHTDTILAELGYSPADIATLASEGITRGQGTPADYIADSFQAPTRF